jgi:hypothetical protein
MCIDPRLQGNYLALYYSRIGDGFDKVFPESILCALVDVTAPLGTWTCGPAFKVKQPRTAHEGAGWPVWESFKGGQKDVHQMRDPYLLHWQDKLYLFCTGEGEEWILGYEIEVDYSNEVGELAPPFNPNPAKWTRPPAGSGEGTASFAQ